MTVSRVIIIYDERRFCFPSLSENLSELYIMMECVQRNQGEDGYGIVPLLNAPFVLFTCIFFAHFSFFLRLSLPPIPLVDHVIYCNPVKRSSACSS